MNGFNSETEQNRKPRCKSFYYHNCLDLCPVCIKKLQSNIKFNMKKRCKDLELISKELGFTDTEEYYKNL